MTEATDLATVPVVVLVAALVEAGKRAGLPTKYAGIAAVGIAILLTFLVAAAEGSLGEEGTRFAAWVLSGIVTGLAAAGLYSQARIVTRSLPSEEVPRDDDKPPTPPNP